MSFKGSSVLVTGAGKGIGRVLCEHLLRQGAHVIGLTRSSEDVDALSVLPEFRVAMVVSQIYAKDIIQRGVPGAIVNISSKASTHAVRYHTAYCASKSALDAMTLLT